METPPIRNPRGAGRKPKGGTRKTFNLAPDVLRALEAQPDQTAYVEQAVREKAARTRP